MSALSTYIVTFRIFLLYYLVLAIYAVLILRIQFWPAKIVPFREYIAKPGHG
jgi:hypothetical protein